MKSTEKRKAMALKKFNINQFNQLNIYGKAMFSRTSDPRQEDEIIECKRIP